MDHLLDEDELPRHERELTLSTGAILGIFLGLVVLCGAFFGFGYNMGRKSAPTPINMAEVAPDATVSTSSSAGNASSAAKPAAGTYGETTPAVPVVVATPKPVRHTPPAEPAADGAAATTPEPTPKPTVTKPVTPAPAPIVRQPAPVAVAPSALSPTVPSAAGSYMVQVAAVSHREDAELLIGALRARGYTVSERNTAGDSFIHVQVGPFRDKKDADAMRQRLLTDGYNAIVKQ